MLQRVEGLLATLMTRHTESTDTRMPIQHEDPIFQRRRKNAPTPDSMAREIDDIAEVSIPALITFLEQELHVVPEDVVVTPTPHQPVSTQAARAMRAYGGGHDPAPPSPAASTTADEMDAKVRAILQRALADLKILAANGTTALPIRRAGTFLDALVAAIASAKASLS
ncbi:MAG: hypothetical protein V4621_02340 [Pseudomonadota bacterium]